MKAARPTLKRETRSGPDPAPDRTPARGNASRESDTAGLAYRLYEKRGRRPGHQLEDWIEAERQLSDQKPSVNGARR